MIKALIPLLVMAILLSIGQLASAGDFNECSQKCDTEYEGCINGGKHFEPSDDEDAEQARRTACKDAQEACWARCAKGTDSAPPPQEQKDNENKTNGN